MTYISPCFSLSDILEAISIHTLIEQNNCFFESYWAIWDCLIQCSLGMHNVSLMHRQDSMQHLDIFVLSNMLRKMHGYFVWYKFMAYVFIVRKILKYVKTHPFFYDCPINISLLVEHTCHLPSYNFPILEIEIRSCAGCVMCNAAPGKESSKLFIFWGWLLPSLHLKLFRSPRRSKKLKK